MKLLTYQTIAFVAAGAATGAGWAVFRPKTGVQVPLPVEKPHSVQRWTFLELTARIDAVRNAETDEARLKAAARLSEIPVAEIPKALEQAPQMEDRKLTLVAKLLLIRWAAADGEAAMNWAWRRFRSVGGWDAAFREITASWAWHQPAKLCEWAKRMAKHSNPELGVISLAIAEASEMPVLQFGSLDRISRSLISVAPREACEILQVRGGYSTEDPHLFESLQTVAAVREALLAFEHLDQLQPNRSQGSQIFAWGLLNRWKKLDPEEFSRSPYAHLIPDWKPPAPSPIPDGPRGWVREFDAWRKSIPDTRPDMADWPAAKQEAWKDLETLRAPQI